jgi:hypothetical protein
MQHRIVQNDDAGIHKGPPVDTGVQLIIAEVIEIDIASARIHASLSPERGEQRLCIVGDACAGGRHRGKESGGHAGVPFLKDLRLPSFAGCTPLQKWDFLFLQIGLRWNLKPETSA